MISPVLANYHTHTPRCQHATGSEEEYVCEAIRLGYRVLGFSDHAPWQFASSFISDCRMLPGQLADYVATVRGLAEKYKGQITIYCGLEAEYFPRYLPWIRQMVADYGLDYLVFGNHFHETEELGIYYGAATTPRQLEAYAESTVRGLESGLYACLAHPDLCLNHYPRFDQVAERCLRRICRAAADCNVPLEYNLLGENRRLTEDHRHDLGYTTPAFWQIAAEYPVKVVVGCDAHTVSGLDQTGRLRQVQQQLRAAGLTVWETLPGLAEK